MARKESFLLRPIPLGVRNRLKQALVGLGGRLNPLWTANPTLGAKMFPFQPSSNEYVVPGPDLNPEKDAEGQPVPPRQIRIGEVSAEEFVKSGREDVDAMLAILAGHQVSPSPSAKILEFGCSSGRQLRHLRPFLKAGQVWGVDLSSEHIFWIQQNLDPGFRVAAVTNTPHLPFRDATFDLIYAGSVFTHLDDLADAWFLELRRITRPGGCLYLTMHDSASLERFQTLQSTFPLARMILESATYRRFVAEKGRAFTVGRSLHSYVFYDTDWLKSHLARFFEVVAVHPHAFRGFQSAWVLRVKD